MEIKTWFVTGANSGIGAGVARAALAAGHRVVVTGRNMEKLRAAFPNGDDAALALIQLDVTDAQQAKSAIVKAVERFGRIDVLVNNAGNSVLGNFEDLRVADFEKQLNTNFYGVVHVLHAALPVLRKQRAGHIINISSVAGGVGLVHCSAYSASKFAVEGLSMAIAAEVERFGIKVTIVEPGFFRTNLLDARNAEVIDSTIDDYANDGTTSETWATYDGTQNGDPLKLGHALVAIAAMDEPPKLFLAGSDAVDVLLPVAQARVRAIEENRVLSASTDGVSST
jgi:NAD(P)-dependent dehydrogenase (short-subunit alcohol dehydrogenase family)